MQSDTYRIRKSKIDVMQQREVPYLHIRAALKQAVVELILSFSVLGALEKRFSNRKSRHCARRRQGRSQLPVLSGVLCADCGLTSHGLRSDRFSN